LLDVLSTLPLIHPSAFPSAVQLVATTISFDQDVKVQVFEMTIRALGAFLSTHQYLDGMTDDEARGYEFGIGKENRGNELDVRVYKGRMLELALDLGRRLLPAFETATGIPYSRVNLRYGVKKGESTETCELGSWSVGLTELMTTRRYCRSWKSGPGIHGTLPSDR